MRSGRRRSLDNALDFFRVSPDGELFVKRGEYKTKEAPGTLLGWTREVVAEWEERVDHHGVVEAYCTQRGQEQVRFVIYDLFFTYGRLTSMERREETYPRVPPRPTVRDQSPVVETAIGALDPRLPASIELRAGGQRGEVWVVHLAFGGSFINAREDGGRVEVRGRTMPEGDAPFIDTDGSIVHRNGLNLSVLAEARQRDQSLVLVLALDSFLG